MSGQDGKPNFVSRRWRDDDHLSWRRIATTLMRATSRPTLLQNSCSCTGEGLPRIRLTTDRDAQQPAKGGPHRITFHLSSRLATGSVLSLWHFP